MNKYNGPFTKTTKTTYYESNLYIVDGSYYCFYRYFALQQWWKNAYPDEPLDDPYANEKFVEKFKKTFVDNLELMPKKLNIHKDGVKPILIVGKDCKRQHIWRNKFVR